MPEKNQKKHVERPIFDSIRKPPAPPTQKFKDERSEEKRLPSLRKAKHRKKDEPEQ